MASPLVEILSLSSRRFIASPTAASKAIVFFDFKDNYRGQITFFALEVFVEVCRQLGLSGKNPGLTRRNVMTIGVDLNSLIGEEFAVQGIQFFGMEECRPCYWMDHALGPGAEAALKNRGGLRARILTSGPLRVDA